MIAAFIGFAAVLALLIVCGISITQDIGDIDQLKIDITFFVISLLGTIVMVHIIIKNRAEIKGLIFEQEDD